MAGTKKTIAEEISVPSMKSLVQKIFQLKVGTEFTEDANHFLRQMIYTLAKYVVISCVFRGKRTVSEQDVRFAVNKLGFYKVEEFKEFMEQCYEAESMRKCAKQIDVVGKVSEKQKQVNNASRIKLKKIPSNEMVMKIHMEERLSIPKIPVANMFKKYSQHVLDDIVSYLVKEFGSEDELYHLVKVYRLANIERRGSDSSKSKIEEFKILKEKHKVSQTTWKLFRGFDKLVPNPIDRNLAGDRQTLFSFGQKAMTKLHMIVEQQLAAHIVTSVVAKQKPKDEIIVGKRKRGGASKTKKNVKRLKQ